MGNIVFLCLYVLNVLMRWLCDFSTIDMDMIWFMKHMYQKWYLNYMMEICWIWYMWIDVRTVAYEKWWLCCLWAVMNIQYMIWNECTTWLTVKKNMNMMYCAFAYDSRGLSIVYPSHCCTVILTDGLWTSQYPRTITYDIFDWRSYETGHYSWT